jgi:hypothetical protein
MLFFVPINWIIAKLNFKYQKGIVTARDKRTSVVNELISSVSGETELIPASSSSFPQIKFIKFGGTEKRWLAKVNDAREVELRWFMKSIVRPSSSRWY